jgi:membrane-associated two-gene conflict system component 1 (EACC1)
MLLLSYLCEGSVMGLQMEISDQAELGSLRDWLRQISGVRVDQIPGTPGPGELGVWDFLEVLAGSTSVLAIAVKTLPDFIRSRRSNVTITVKVDGEERTLDATNVDDVLPIVERLLDGRRPGP